MRTFSRLVLIPATVVLLAAVACSNDAAETDADVQVSLRDDGIDASPTTAAAGKLTFSASNEGTATHEYEIFSLPAGVDIAKLPVKSNVADTDAAGLTLIDEVEDIAPGTSADLSVTLKAGSYALICNLAGHYAKGMYESFTVS